MKNESTPPAIPKPLFSLGEIASTPAALAVLEHHHIAPLTLLMRHVTGDWGEELSDHDRQQNQFALRSGLRLFSAYKINEQTTIWVITEADRSSTTLLLPDEY